MIRRREFIAALGSSAMWPLAATNTAGSVAQKSGLFAVGTSEYVPGYH